MRWAVWLLLAASLIGGARWFLYDRDVRHTSGVLAPAEPGISIAPNPPTWIDPHGIRYRGLGRMEGRVVVVARKNYSIGPFARLAPTDLAIVWGPLSDPDLYGQLVFDQRGSPFGARYVAPELRRGTPLSKRPHGEIAALLLGNLTHVHAIPGNADIASRLAHIRPGQVIEFTGILVDVVTPEGSRVASSLKLHDLDCEVAWIDTLELVD